MLPASTTHAHAASAVSSATPVLLACGVLSSLVYVAANVVGAVVWEGYSSWSQTISELSAIGAPSRSAWMPFGVAYGVLVVAFGIGVWRSAAGTRRLRATGALLAAVGALGLVWPPMHLRGSVGTVTDTMHIAFAGVVSLLILLAVASGAAASGRRFRTYSVATLAALVLSGAATALHAPRVAADLPTPGMGLLERANLGAYLAWVAVLAVQLLRAQRARSCGSFHS
jgi:hypothetical protein